MKAFLVSILFIFIFSQQAHGFATAGKWLKEAFTSSTQRRATPVRPQARPGSISNYSGECRVTNPGCTSSGSRVVADMTAQCMCVDNECFKISIGSRGPKVTRNGTSRLGVADGGIYDTNNIVPPTTYYDNDAISMGIPRNDPPGMRPITTGGKWIHKTRNCRDTNDYPTWGCIGVECNDWPKVKNCMGCTFTVCGGAETDDDIVSNHTGRNRKGEYYPKLSNQERYDRYRVIQDAAGAVR